MNKFLKVFLVSAIVASFCVSSVADARPSFNPKGWFKGKKKGWEGESTPPGLSKKEAKKMKKEAKKAKEEAKDLKENVENTVQDVKTGE